MLKQKPKFKLFGKIRESSGRAKEILDGVRKERGSWAFEGERYRFKSVFLEELKSKPITFLKKLSKKNPNVMFLGPGKGEYIAKFKKYLKQIKIDPKIDTFGLTKTIYPSLIKKKIVKRDYSNKIPFEHLNSKLYPKLIKAFRYKYDLIIAPMSVAYHTKYIANAIFTSALMLKKNGKAYLEVKHTNLLTKTKAKLYWLLLGSKSKKEDIYYNKQLSNIRNIFEKMVNLYDPKLKFELDIIEYKDPKFEKVSNFVEIERIN